MNIDKSFFCSAYTISDDQFAKFNHLLGLFDEKNKQMNLSAIREENDIWDKHFFDSLLAAEFLKNAKNILDLGTGGGFPILPLAIIFPDKKFCGVESVQKKCVAVEGFVKDLNMHNVKMFCDRAEDLAHRKDLRENFDIVTARAFAKFPVLLEIGLPFLKVGGFLLAFRGSDNDKDDFVLTEKLGGKVINVAKRNLQNGDDRQIWIIEKVKISDKKYPRKVGMPKKQPLGLKDFGN